MKTPEFVIADTSSLIVFKKIGRLELLQFVYSEITITSEVESEYGETLPAWVRVENASNQEQQKFLEGELDTGEASSIALAMEYPDSLMILDDLKARKVARKFNLVFTGTLGVISKARAEGYLNELKPIIDQILETNFRISDQVIRALLSKHEE
ncbi:DUF3368 domain-containing protein [Euhalothece natronophila Z-M001]|uniref:DUF3368 domain-containing protein n=1 Tax=Euhalothece natronophila Z-M001 TaxID=522448 RepID=A0A5B8NP42_9CHRO|nr:DUF3368 domain-containing protein [Euhalothece natronophila]QDZ40727.1 DUF3368 domain-containing protein [Euhalothece natronophila Z-M001]